MNYYYLFIIGYISTQHLALQKIFALNGNKLMLVTSVSAILLMLLFEKWKPYNIKWRKSNGDRFSDFLHTIILFPVIHIIVQTAFLAWFSYTPVQKSGVSAAAGLFVFYLLLCEFGYYWFHRLAHTSSFLWKFHRMHHAPARLYWMNSALFHPVEMLVSTAVYLAPLYLLGAPPGTILLIASWNVITGFLEHANINTRSGWLNYIFNTAELHRGHHCREADPPVNFGKVLSVWDWVFRSARLPGFSDELGTEDRNPPVKLWPQWKYPFSRPGN